MGGRFWIGLLVVAALFTWGAGYVLAPENGEAEFQKMFDAMRQVKSFRGTFVGKTPITEHSERLWEVDCYRGIVHKQSTELPNTPNAVETTTISSS